MYTAQIKKYKSMEWKYATHSCAPVYPVISSCVSLEFFYEHKNKYIFTLFFLPFIYKW